MSSSATNAKGSRPPEAADARSDRVEIGIAAAILATAVAGFTSFAWRGGVRGADLVGACAIFMVFFGPCLALAVSRWTERLAAWLAPAPGMRVAALWIVSLACYAGYGAWQGVPVLGTTARLALYGLLPILILARVARARRPILETPVRFALAIAAICLPIEFRLVRGALLPAGASHGLDATYLAAASLGLVLVLAVSPVQDVGYSFRLGRRDLARAGLALAAFAAVAIPLGLPIGFIAWNPAGHGLLEWARTALSIYFVTGIPEELLFRGLLQNLLEKRWPGRRVPALLLASLVFGAFHLNNPRAPNWPYMMLASLAGLAYGWVWMRTRKITASALTHMGVDLVWVELLQK